MDYQNETIGYYDANANEYFSDTEKANVENLRNIFLSYLTPGSLILDFGCGSGRDSRAFLQAGYLVDPIDGSEKLCRLAEKNIGRPVRQMYFKDLNARDQYDGVWACASVLHLNKEDIINVFQLMETALKPTGYVYTTFKYGTFEGMRNKRYFTDVNEEGLKDIVSEVPALHIIRHWITSDVRVNRSNEKWLNAILQKI